MSQFFRAPQRRVETFFTDPVIPKELQGFPSTLKTATKKLVETEYKYIKELGKGIYGTAFKVMEKSTGRFFVIKEILVNPKMYKYPPEVIHEKLETAVNEYMYQRRLLDSDGPGRQHIVTVYDVALRIDPDNYGVFILMEQMSFSLLSLRDLPNAAQIFQTRWLTETMKGILHMHSNNIVHRDMHFGNVMVSSGGVAKIADFGLSCYNNICNGPREIQQDGNQLYMAPIMKEFDMFFFFMALRHFLVRFPDHVPKFKHLKDMASKRLANAASFLPQKTLKHYKFNTIMKPSNVDVIKSQNLIAEFERVDRM